MGHRSQTHCKHGHAFTPENTYWSNRKPQPKRNRKGGRFRTCKTCHKEGAKYYRVYKYHGDGHAARKRRDYQERRPSK